MKRPQEVRASAPPGGRRSVWAGRRLAPGLTCQKIRLQRQLFCIRKMTLTHGLFSNRAEQLVHYGAFRGSQRTSFSLFVCAQPTKFLNDRTETRFMRSTKCCAISLTGLPKTTALIDISAELQLWSLNLTALNSRLSNDKRNIAKWFITSTFSLCFLVVWQWHFFCTTGLI